MYQTKFFSIGLSDYELQLQNHSLRTTYQTPSMYLNLEFVLELILLPFFLPKVRFGNDAQKAHFENEAQKILQTMIFSSYQT